MLLAIVCNASIEAISGAVWVGIQLSDTLNNVRRIANPIGAIIF